MQSLHKAIPMEVFMKELAPTVWPPGKRAGTGVMTYLSPPLV